VSFQSLKDGKDTYRKGKSIIDIPKIYKRRPKVVWILKVAKSHARHDKKLKSVGNYNPFIKLQS